MLLPPSIFLTGLRATTFNVGPRGRLGWDFCSHTVVSFTARPNLVVLVGSSKAVLTAEVLILAAFESTPGFGRQYGEG